MHIFLARCELDAGIVGTVYDDTPRTERALRDSTPLLVARYFGHDTIVRLLNESEEQLEAVAPTKRSRSKLPMYERAVAAGVAEKFNPIPAELRLRIETGSEDERILAKKEVQKIQIANQQMVARAENRQKAARGIASALATIC